jgi:hypothetical protein
MVSYSARFQMDGHGTSKFKLTGKLSASASSRHTNTAWKNQKVMLHSKLKRPTISTHFQSPSEGVGKCDAQRTPRRRRHRVDGFSNNKRSNGSNTHPLKSAILISRAWSDTSRPVTSVRKSPRKSLKKSLRLCKVPEPARGPAE